MNHVTTSHLGSFGRLTGETELDSNPKFMVDPKSVTQSIRFSNSS